MLEKGLDMEVKKEKEIIQVGGENRVLKGQKACWVPETCYNPGARNESQNV